jgi:uncharacterized membrane-anchored protein YhcB (DUF1043 family)
VLNKSDMMETQGQIDEYKAEIEKHYEVDSL